MELELLNKLTRDLRKAAKTLSKQEVRYLVDAYYMMQEDRIRSNNQVRALSESGEPNDVIHWLAQNSRILEDSIKSALDAYSKADVLGEWARSVKGIGPVTAAGLLAHIDLEKAPTVGHIWRFAGLDPTVKWNKKQKRPWNAALKTLCWKIGESFVKQVNREDAVYARFYAERKAQEEENNLLGKYADQAAKGAERVGKDTDAYKFYSVGKLPPAHIHARAKRYAVKLFLSHFHEQGYRLVLKKEPPKPYPIEHLGHAHIITP